jgi:uncharacterized protein
VKPEVGVPADVLGSARPVPNAPALVVRPASGGRPAVVVADLHLGLASGPETPRGPPGASAPELAEQLVRLCRGVPARRLVVAGDVKHPIVGVPPWLRPVVFDLFATLLDDGVVPEIVLGNHDVGLVPYLPREVVVHPAVGALVAGVGIFHGHRWPADRLLSAPTLVTGHLHPGYRFAPTADAPNGKRKAWVRVAYPPGQGVLRRDGRPARVRELIVLPAFHPLAGTEALNRDRPERGRSFLYGRFLARGEARAYLLDGTDLGRVPTPPDPARTEGDARAPPGSGRAARSSGRSRRSPALRPPGRTARVRSGAP